MKKEEEKINARILARTRRLKGETVRQHLNRMYKMSLKEKKELYK